MPFFKVLLLSVVSISLFSLQSCKKELTQTDVIKRRWTLTETYKNQTSTKADSSEYFLLNNEGFKCTLGSADEASQSGQWQIDSSRLSLTYNPKPSNIAVDSVVYRVIDNKPVVLYYKNGLLLAQQTDNLKANSTKKSFSIKELTESRLVLIGDDNQTYTYKYDLVLKDTNVSFSSILNGMIGVFSLLFILFLLSENRKQISWKLVISGCVIQIVFAVLVLKVGFIRNGFEYVSGFFVVLLDFTREGSAFLFGGLINPSGSAGYIFALQVLPTIIFFSAFTSALYYLGVLQRIVYGFAWVMSKAMNLSGSESLAAAANIFLGQTEAPLMIKPYIKDMNRSELLALMAGGMATIAGGVLAAYIGFLGGDDPAQRQFFANHLLIASIMSAPAALVAAKMLVPQTQPYNKDLKVNKENIGQNLLEAIANGTGDGLRLAVNVGAMLLVFTALMALMNSIFQSVSGYSLQQLLGYGFAPIAWLMGVRGENNILLVGQLIGEKTILNEFVGYTTLGTMKQSGALTDTKAIIIATYALCGFSNFASIGIQIGGIGALAPNKRGELASLGIKALVAGTAACLLTAAIAGMLL